MERQVRRRALAGALVAAGLCGMAGCAHLKGVVIEDPSGRPMRTAVFTVGRPNGIAILDRHTVDGRGAFDFSLFPTDENDLYLYDGAGDPELTMRRVDASEMSDHMRLFLRAAPRQNPGDGDMGSGFNVPAVPGQ